MQLTYAQVQDARRLLGKYLLKSRLIRAESLCGASMQVWLKLESELPTGSFKPRGAIYALHAHHERTEIKEVVAASTGNHGAAVAYAGLLLGVPATIFLPHNPNPVKRAKIAELGANIIEEGTDISDAFFCASEHAKSSGAYFLNDATDPELLAGPATIACEILEQSPNADCIVVPMGDTALIRGLAFAAKHQKPAIRIIGVQAECAPSYYLSWKAGRPVPTDTCDTVADGLATRTPVEENVRDVRDLVDDVQLVGEEEMLAAIRHLLLQEHVLAEPAGAAATAALLRNPRLYQDRQIVLIVSGANISEEVLRAAIC
jgi:threonine dehydratase